MCDKSRNVARPALDSAQRGRRLPRSAARRLPRSPVRRRPRAWWRLGRRLHGCVFREARRHGRALDLGVGGSRWNCGPGECHRRTRRGARAHGRPRLGGRAHGTARCGSRSRRGSKERLCARAEARSRSRRTARDRVARRRHRGPRCAGRRARRCDVSRGCGGGRGTGRRRCVGCGPSRPGEPRSPQRGPASRPRWSSR